MKAIAKQMKTDLRSGPSAVHWGGLSLSDNRLVFAIESSILRTRRLREHIPDPRGLREEHIPFGRHRSVGLVSFSVAGTSKRHRQAQSDILDSFQFLPGHAYVESASPSPRRPAGSWDRILELGIVGAVIGGVLPVIAAVGAFVVRKLRRAKSPDQTHQE